MKKALAVLPPGFKEEKLDMLSRVYTRAAITRLASKMILMFEPVIALIWTQDQGEIVMRIARDLKLLVESTQEGWRLDETTRKPKLRASHRAGRKGER